MRPFKKLKKRIQLYLSGPEKEFHAHHYLRNNARRLEHLSSLGVDVRGAKVLEVGAGIGDHTHYYIDRDCQVVTTEIRQGNVDFIKKRYAREKRPVDVRFLDMDAPSGTFGNFDVVHCYGLLYHLKNPEVALDFLGDHCGGVLFLETVVSFEDNFAINPVTENQFCPSQAYSGQGCRPSRRWVVETLKKKFKHVYIPSSQPNHEEFPLDWDNPSAHGSPLARSIFVASQKPLNNPLLSEAIPANRRATPERTEPLSGTMLGKLKRRLALKLIHGSAIFFEREFAQKLHRFLLRFVGVKVGKFVYVSEGFHLHKPKNITLGDRTFISANARLVGYSKITIGEDFLAAEDLLINSGSHDINTLEPQTGDITIGDRVWCGARVTICEGVTIGNDVVIGAGSVVLKDIPSGVVAVGVPCKSLRKLDRTSDTPRWSPFQDKSQAKQ